MRNDENIPHSRVKKPHIENISVYLAKSTDTLNELSETLSRSTAAMLEVLNGNKNHAISLEDAHEEIL